jgi:hypothetical protein
MSLDCILEFEEWRASLLKCSHLPLIVELIVQSPLDGHIHDDDVPVHWQTPEALYRFAMCIPSKFVKIGLKNIDVSATELANLRDLELA